MYCQNMLHLCSIQKKKKHLLQNSAVTFLPSHIKFFPRDEVLEINCDV